MNAMRHDASPAPLHRRHHLGYRRATLDELLEIAGGAATQQRPFPARKDSGEVTGLHAGRSVTNPVDASELADERASLQSVLDLIPADPAPQ